MNLYLAGDTYGKHIFPKVDFRFNKLDTFWYIYKNAQAEKDITKYDDFLLDSGAFTFIMAKRKGQSINVDIDYFTDAYCDYINNFHIDKFFEMDVDSVLGYEKVKQLRKRIEQRTGKQPIPVFHKSRGKEEFMAHCRDYSYIALGIAGKDTSVTDWKTFLAFVMKAKEYDVKVHGLGITGMSVLKKVPFYSVDSSSWVNGSKFKSMFLFNGKELITIRKELENKRISNQQELGLHNLREWIKLSNYLKNREIL